MAAIYTFMLRLLVDSKVSISGFDRSLQAFSYQAAIIAHSAMRYDEPSALNRLKELHRRGCIEELKKLIYDLEDIGYPSSILNGFRNITHAESTQHPYIYNWPAETRELGLTSKTAEVSIIVVSYNSREDLNRLLPSLVAQSYTNWRLVLIENGDQETESLIHKFLAADRFTYVKANNPGFADANNLGLEYAEGELLLLLNPDTTLEAETLKNLVRALAIDASAAAACPLIYFASPFYKLTLESMTGLPFYIDLSLTIDEMEYKKIFVVAGKRVSQFLFASDTNNCLSLEIPLNANSEELAIRFIFDSQNNGSSLHLVRIHFEESNQRSQFLNLSVDDTIARVKLTSAIHSGSRYLINNAGSGLRADQLEVFDIGFGEVDHGFYSSRAYREAFCGCCVLLRRDLFIKRKIFVSEFFAYFEDSELSHWIRANRMNILYVPNAIVYHRHSETMVEGSPFRELLVERNHQIYKAFVKSSDKPLELTWNTYGQYSSLIEESLLQKIVSYDEGLAGIMPASAIYRNDKVTVGIYNSYWHSKGGGEKHALDLARLALDQHCEVYLIAETDFSLLELQAYFGISLVGIKKLICGTVSESLTQRFDIFINSTYYSKLISFASRSYYIVSFPHPKADDRFLESYHFLHNSLFTLHWAKRYWGRHNYDIILPILGFAKQAPLRSEKADQGSIQMFNCKEPILLCVGRFTYQGHCKNQHLLAQLFRSLVDRGLVPKDWIVIICGSVDEADPSSINHYRETARLLDGYPAKVIANIQAQELKMLYKRASIFVHLTGLGSQAQTQPELCEHFGITPFEAMLNGCFPIVYHEGGPALQVKAVHDACTFTAISDLANGLINTMNMIDHLSEKDHQDLCARLRKHGQGQIHQSLKQAKQLFGVSRG